MSGPTVTINSLKNDYKSYLQAENPKINAFAPESSWSVLAGGTSGVLLDLYFNLQLVLNSIYVQNAIGDQVDLWLYARGLPPRGGLTFATVQVYITSTTPVTIDANTIFTDSTTTNQYQTLQTVTVGDDSTYLTLYALQPGSAYYEPLLATMTAGAIDATVQISTGGQNEESDQSCITRVLTAIRAPIAGARQTDYQVYALDYNATVSSPVVTDSITIPSFVTIGTVGSFGLFCLGGTPITEYQLNQGLASGSFIAFSRALSGGDITAINDYIQSLRLAGLPIIVGTSITYNAATDSSHLAATISLVSGYSLTTVLNIPSQDIDFNPISIQLTVKELLRREIRRAICNQPYGGTKIASNNYITLDSIYQAVNNQLSVNGGNLVQILTNIEIAGGDISVPNYNFSDTNVYYTYDIEDYNDITFTVI